MSVKLFLNNSVGFLMSLWILMRCLRKNPGIPETNIEEISDELYNIHAKKNTNPTRM